MKVSVIIPVLNEADQIAETLASLAPYRNQGHEVIVVDGGSSDETQSLAAMHADKVLHRNMGRAQQMNRGIDEARGDVLLFLHADTRLPSNGLKEVISAVEDGGFWGRFNVRLSGEHFMLRVIERMMNLRSCVTGVATGDQAMFVSRESVAIVGQFPQIPLMEDVVFSKRLRELAWPVCVRQHVTTSSRRWEHRGVFRTVLLMWRLRLLFFLGVSADKLARQYQ